MWRLGDIASRLGGEIVGDENITVRRVAPLEEAGPDDLSFLTNPKYRHQLRVTRAAAVIMAPPVDKAIGTAILTPQPYLYFARVSQLLNPSPALVPGVHTSAVVDGEVGPGACVGPNSWIGRGARIADGVVIGANCSIGEGVHVGERTRLAANVSIYPNCEIGADCIVHAGVVIGADGFGFARESDGSWVKIPQVGRVLIGNAVEIGAGTTIDRGALGDTVIGDGVKLDNQIQIGHNVRIGEHTAMAGCVGVAGSAMIGARCTVGGGAIILGHLSIADGVDISAGTLVAKSISRPGRYSGTVPFLEHGDWLRNFAHVRHLDAMADRIRSLEQRLAQLEGKK